MKGETGTRRGHPSPCLPSVNVLSGSSPSRDGWIVATASATGAARASSSPGTATTREIGSAAVAGRRWRRTARFADTSGSTSATTRAFGRCAPRRSRAAERGRAQGPSGGVGERKARRTADPLLRQIEAAVDAQAPPAQEAGPGGRGPRGGLGRVSRQEAGDDLLGHGSISLVGGTGARRLRLAGRGNRAPPSTGGSQDGSPGPCDRRATPGRSSGRPPRAGE